VATPAIFPVPIVADNDVINALNGLICPSSSPGIRPFHNKLNPKGIRLIVKNRKPTVKNRPTPKIKNSIGGPQTIPFSQPTTLFSISM